MEERLLPERVGHVDVDGSVPGRFSGRQPAGQVLELERHVVRTGAAAVEEAAEEVVALDQVGLEHLHAHAVGVAQLARSEARPLPTRHPPATEKPYEPRPGVGPLFDGDGDVVEVDAFDGTARARHASSSSYSSTCSLAIRSVEK